MQFLKMFIYLFFNVFKLMLIFLANLDFFEFFMKVEHLRRRQSSEQRQKFFLKKLPKLQKIEKKTHKKLET